MDPQRQGGVGLADEQLDLGAAQHDRLGAIRGEPADHLGVRRT
jgi:hypothetical protein